jgi:predicted RNA-binding protein (TIGR00451 family)
LSVRRRHYLRSSQVAEAITQLAKSMPTLDIGALNGRQIEVADLGNNEEGLYLMEGKPAFLKTSKGFFPTLVNRDALHTLPTLTVDAGAVPHICNGSALMAPGIVKVEGDFPKDALVAVREATYGKTIAVVRTLTDSEETRSAKKGRVAVSVHYIGDILWDAYKSLA